MPTRNIVGFAQGGELPNFAKDLKDLGLFNVIKTDKTDNIEVAYMDGKMSSSTTTPSNYLIESVTGTESTTEFPEVEISLRTKRIDIEDIEFDYDDIFNKWYELISDKITNHTTINTNFFDTDDELRKELISKFNHASANISRESRFGGATFIMGNYSMLCFLNKPNKNVSKFSTFFNINLVVNDDMGDFLIVGRCNTGKHDSGPSIFIFNDSNYPNGLGGFFIQENISSYLHKISLTDSQILVAEEEATMGNETDEFIEEMFNTEQETNEDVVESVNTRKEIDPFETEEFEDVKQKPRIS